MLVCEDGYYPNFSDQCSSSDRLTTCPKLKIFHMWKIWASGMDNWIRKLIIFAYINLEIVASVSFKRSITFKNVKFYLCYFLYGNYFTYKYVFRYVYNRISHFLKNIQIISFLIHILTQYSYWICERIYTTLSANCIMIFDLACNHKDYVAFIKVSFYW